MSSSRLILAVLLLGSVSCTGLLKDSVTFDAARQNAITPQEAQKKLERGNSRFAHGQHLHRNLLEQSEKTAEHQFPYACVLSCMDSRASSELIFDQGIGDIFNVRVAGNVVNNDVLGSLEYAAKKSHSKLIAVVGHTHCGAVGGACDNVDLGHLTSLVKKIKPAVAGTPSEPGEDRSSENQSFVSRVAEKNVHLVMAGLRAQSPILRDLEKAGTIKIVGGIYDIETHKVRFFD